MKKAYIMNGKFENTLYTDLPAGFGCDYLLLDTNGEWYHEGYDDNVNKVIFDGAANAEWQDVDDEDLDFRYVVKYATQEDIRMMDDITADEAASSLYDGGWRSTDKEEIMETYVISGADAKYICERLAELDNK